MTSKLTRERLEKIKSWRETYGAGSNVMLPAEEAKELACLALAAMDSEPVDIPEMLTPVQASRAYCGEVRGYRDGWNACRAAMLNGGKS